jgi:hypothetical protein
MVLIIVEDYDNLMAHAQNFSDYTNDEEANKSTIRETAITGCSTYKLINTLFSRSLK